MATTVLGVETGQGTEPTGSAVSQILEAFFRCKKTFLILFSVFFGLTLLYVFGSHKKYQSNMSLLVQNARKQVVISADAESQGSAPAVTEEDLYSQVEVLGSQDVLDQVVDPNWRKVPVTSHSRQEQENHEAKVGALRGRLVIAPVRKSYVIDVSFTSLDPKLATDTLNRLLVAYLEHEKRITSQAGASDFFKVEADRYQAEWQAAQRELADFQQTHDMVSTASRETDLGSAMAEALTLQRAAQAEVAEVSKRLGSEQRLLASTEKREKISETLNPATGSIDQSSSQLTQLNLRRSQLLTEYKPSDRIVLQVESQIAAAKEELANAQTMHSASVTTSINPTWQTLDQQVQEDRAHFAAASARQAAIGAQTADLQNQMQRAEQDSVRFNILAQNVATLAANYQLYAQKRDASTISQAMDAQGLLNIAVLQSPTYSLSAVRPRPKLDTLLGLVASFLLASLAVYLVEANRRTVTSAPELKGISRHPVLASVPMGHAGDVRRRSRAS